MTAVIVVLDSQGSTLTEDDRDALALGSDLGAVCAVLRRAASEAVLTELGEFGAVQVLTPVDVCGSGPAALAAAVATELRGGTYSAVVVAPTLHGREIVGRLAARIDEVVVTAVARGTSTATGLDLVVSEQAGRVHRHLRVDESIVLLVVERTDSRRSRSEHPRTVPTLRVLAASADSIAPAVQAAVGVQDEPTTALSSARIVVAGGRGVGSKQQLARLGAWAASVGAAFGASRAPVESGWAPYQRLVGQTGTVIAPDVYLAFGISGASQHLAGVRGAHLIVAVNTDADAPIFAESDIAIVAPVEEVLDLLEGTVPGD